MSKSICRTCSYYMPGDPGACNALHVPSIDKIDCSDWQLKADIRQIESSAIERLTEEQARSVTEALSGQTGLSAIELQLRDAERFRAATRPTQQPSITLSQLQEAMRGCPRPRGLRDVWRIALPGDPMPYYSININSDFPATEASFELVTVTPIETPDGLKWSFQGTVILD